MYGPSGLSWCCQVRDETTGEVPTNYPLANRWIATTFNQASSRKLRSTLY